VVKAVAAFYAVLAMLLGVAFSWQWAAVVALLGAIPAFLIWLAAGNLGNFRHYYERRGWDNHRKK
jgi:hypothetical protein